MTRAAFYDRVQQVVQKEDISQPQAYEKVEQAYHKQYGMRRYVSYQAFHWSNYSAMCREIKQRKKYNEITGRLHDLCEQLRKNDISQPDFVATVRDMVFSK